MTKRRTETDKTTFAGITLKETTKTYERDTFLGIPYGKERKVNEETDYLKLDDSTKKAIKDGIDILSGIPFSKNGQKKLPYKR